MTRKGSLVVVGTGISIGQLTLESKAWISSAEKVLYCVADIATEALIVQLNPNAESLYCYYGEGKPRKDTYREMIERTLECVRSGLDVCVVYYGHPGIFVHPSHESIRLAREEGYVAKMLPAVSALDCLCSDLGIDPSKGCQTFEATDFLLRRRKVDIESHVIVWQIAATGDLAFSFGGFDCRHVPSLVRYLMESYPGDHEVTVYEAAQYAVCEPVIQKITLQELAKAKITGISTLYVPPLKKGPIHLSMIEALGLKRVLESRTLIPIESNT